MSFSTSTHLGLQKPSDGETAWGNEVRAIYDTIDSMAAPDHTYFVSAKFTDAVFANSPSDRRHFDTIQKAITQSETKADSQYRQIVVFPGLYQEDLTITKSAHFVNIAAGGGYGAAGTVSLQGTGNNPVMTVNPIASTVLDIGFHGFRFSNQNPSHGGTTVTDPLFLHVTDQTLYGGYKNIILFNGCAFRHDSNSNAADVYTYGIRVTGKSMLCFRDSTIKVPDSGGGDMTYPIYVEGDFADGQTAGFQAEGTLFYQTGLSGDIITMANGSEGYVRRCHTNRSNIDLVRNFTGSGSNTCNGLTDASEWAAYGNLFSTPDQMTLG